MCIDQLNTAIGLREIQKIGKTGGGGTVAKKPRRPGGPVTIHRPKTTR